MLEAQAYNLRVGTALGSPKWKSRFTSASFATTVKHIQNTWLIATFVALLPCLCTRAQTSTTGFFPEVDSYARLTSNVRLVLQAKGYMEEGDFMRAELGPSFQFNPRPSEKLRKLSVFDMDDMKPMPVVFSIGYRYLPSATGPSTNRLEPLVMLHIPMPGRIFVTDRNRADLDWSNNNFTWRYRNRITAERRVTIHNYHPGPYASAEFFYQSQYSKWSSTRLYVGCLLPLTKLNRHLELDPYYEHENNTGQRPNRQLNIGGFIISLYFPPNRD
jgi:hypothetical protein